MEILFILHSCDDSWYSLNLQDDSLFHKKTLQSEPVIPEDVHIILHHCLCSNLDFFQIEI